MEVMADSRAAPAGTLCVYRRSARVKKAGRSGGSVAMHPMTTVLVVDDDAEIRDLIATTLEAGGYAVNTASDGAEALRLANQHEPGAVILDVMMPVMDGWEF